MRDIYKNPILYYVSVTVLVGLWPLLVWAVYLPTAQDSVTKQMDLYEEAKLVMRDILTLDPERLEFTELNEADTEFTYDGAVFSVANSCNISAGNRTVRTGMKITTREQKSQTANVDLKQVGIVKFTEFLSKIQVLWIDLQCESVKLTKKENLPGNDMWDVDIKFRYIY